MEGNNQTPQATARNKYQMIYVPLTELRHLEGNPRVWSKEATDNLTTSINNNDMLQPLVINSAPGREGIIIGGNFRFEVMKKLNYTEAPVIKLSIPDSNQELKLALELNKSIGDWNFDLLSQYDESLLSEAGFNSEELDQIFSEDDQPEEFDLQKELEKLDISQITMQKGEKWALGDSVLMIGDSTVQEDILKLTNGEKVDCCMTDSPYFLDYLHGKSKHGEATTGFGYKKNRRYLETDVLPPDFMAKWMSNIHLVQKENFSIISFENWRNLTKMQLEMKKYWKIKNLLIWHIPNRHQGFSSKYKFFSKHDIALVGAAPNVDIEFNQEEEQDGLQEEYESALFAISGRPYWEGYKKGNGMPTDFAEFIASDEKNSGQGVVFGCKPVELLIPYLKVLTKRGDLIIEPFGGSGSTLIAATKMKRRCFIMEKVPAYAEVIRHRWEKLTGERAVRIDGK